MIEKNTLYERRIRCPLCNRKKPEKPKLNGINYSPVKYRCKCGCIYTVRKTMKIVFEIKVV